MYVLVNWNSVYKSIGIAALFVYAWSESVCCRCRVISICVTAIWASFPLTSLFAGKIWGWTLLFFKMQCNRNLIVMIISIVHVCAVGPFTNSKTKFINNVYNIFIVNGQVRNPPCMNALLNRLVLYPYEFQQVMTYKPNNYIMLHLYSYTTLKYCMVRSSV